MDASTENAKMLAMLSDLQISRYNALAAATIIIFDHVNTLGEEVELIWKERPSWGSVLFILNRYYGLFAAIFNTYTSLSNGLSISVRHFWIKWQSWTAVFTTTAITQLVLILRIRAMYSNDRSMTIVMCIAFVFSLTSCTVIMNEAIREISVTVMSVSGRTFCRPSSAPATLPAYFIPVIVFETFLFGLAVVKWVRDVGFRLSSRAFAPALLHILVLDSVVYFIVMTAAYAMNALLWIVKPEVPELPIGFVIALACVMGDRLILNIRARHIRTTQHPSVFTLGRDLDPDPERT
ncbi:hypothetical protein DENSPDRAFT_282104 [Dentipellis sp. KUC8613]|nr:hypothetical protein DENSPDRAFT_282104 [Dentipellis sp. KUC8613]